MEKSPESPCAVLLGWEEEEEKRKRKRRREGERGRRRAASHQCPPMIQVLIWMSWADYKGYIRNKQITKYERSMRGEWEGGVNARRRKRRTRGKK